MTTSTRVQAAESEAAVNALRECGFVILEEAVASEPLKVLRERMDRDTEELLAYCESIGGNPRELGHLQQGPPVSKDYVFADIAMNGFVNRVCNRLFDHRPRLTFYNGNTNCPGSTMQRLHMDGRHATLEPDPVSPISSVVVDIPPGPMNKGNGAIEIWPGSHLVRPPEGGPRVPEELEAKRRAIEGPIQAETCVGDVLIRDTRLWHRGVPNRSRRPRHMIALIVSDGRLPVGGKLDFQRGCEDALEGHSVDSNANYTDQPIDYLFSPTRRIYEHRQAVQKEAKEGKLNSQHST
ncbi:MAG: phytanoyl-CoA dioxygenase family protein [Gammaproteobacteria bacterium]|nr:phytanoyl-CoA dioxygenase family protein [Gammaproteobacteria bacterium]